MVTTQPAVMAYIMSEIARPGSTRESIAAAYAEGIRQRVRLNRDGYINWRTVRRAISKRYTPSGLAYIKRRAWALSAQGKP